MVLLELLKASLAKFSIKSDVKFSQVTLEVQREDWLQVAKILRDDKALKFDTLIDVCGVDYLHYGLSEWASSSVATNGYSRARSDLPNQVREPRFASVYHLLSTSENHRLRIVIALSSDQLFIDSACSIWPVANWFEREAYDLYGIVYEGHPDLRRILTDYGFIGHPLRKDFPLSGQVEIGYDASKQGCVYRPVDIQPRVTVAKVIRNDERYNPNGTES
ncbi:MAG: NADH-quinone oxidoreductase subunit C [Gammaproteobacteria bacterium]|jgi:NADH-quinone oxidoreductase subunit C|nr:NADH-quinone oxidoreductase subunit C [Gammaproteobacteria bacterium]